MDAEVYSLVKTSVKKLYNIDLNYYKDEQMKRRLDSWLARTQSNGWSEYFSTLHANPVEWDRFRNYLTINVTEFFRDPERWKALRTDILPALVQSKPALPGGRSGLRVWSAGCSIGVEAYTLAMLLDEALPGQQHTLFAGDIDRGALKKAMAGGPYMPEELRNLTPEQRQKYLSLQPPYYVKELLTSRIRFMEQDLLMDRFEDNLDLIVCRNVIIYFTNEAKNLLYRKFHAALRPGGVLFLGGTEIIPRPQEIGFKNHAISFYLKVQG